MQKMNSILNFIFEILRSCELVTLLYAWSYLEITIGSPYRKLWGPKSWNQLAGKFDVYVHTVDKTNFISNFFWEDFTSLLYSELWECFIIPVKNHRTKETVGNCHLVCFEKINFITHFLLKILQRNRKRVIFVNLGMPGHIHLKW